MAAMERSGQRGKGGGGGHVAGSGLCLITLLCSPSSNTTKFGRITGRLLPSPRPPRAPSSPPCAHRRRRVCGEMVLLVIKTDGIDNLGGILTRNVVHASDHRGGGENGRREGGERVGGGRRRWGHDRERRGRAAREQEASDTGGEHEREVKGGRHESGRRGRERGVGGRAAQALGLLLCEVVWALGVGPTYDAKRIRDGRIRTHQSPPLESFFSSKYVAICSLLYPTQVGNDG